VPEASEEVLIKSITIENRPNSKLGARETEFFVRLRPNIYTDKNIYRLSKNKDNLHCGCSVERCNFTH